jgi:hypothetical protein
VYPPIPAGLSREKHVARLSLKSLQTEACHLGCSSRGWVVGNERFRTFWWKDRSLPQGGPQGSDPLSSGTQKREVDVLPQRTSVEGLVSLETPGVKR